MDLIAAHPFLSVLLTLLASSTGTFFLSRLFMSKKEAADVARDLYSALSAQVTSLSARVDSLQHTVDDWRTKYYTLLEECTTLKLENARLRAEIDLLNPKPALYGESTSKLLPSCS